MRALLVINPRATTTTPRAREVLVAALADAVKLDVRVTEARAHATELAAEAAVDGYDAVIALGGDGTVNEVVNGILSTRAADRRAADLPAVGIVPGGSSNVLARILGLPVDTVEAAGALLELLRASQTRTLGLGRAGDRWFTFNAGLGWDAGAVARVEAAREAGRKASDLLYVKAAVAEYSRSTSKRRPAVLAHLAGEDPLPLGLAFVTNTSPWTYLGAKPIIVTPEASFDTGLDLFGMTSVPLLPVLRSAATMLSGNPRGRRVVIRHDLSSLVLTSTEEQPLQVDGDFIGRHSHVTFHAESEALRFLC
jgi:diacylglycerol kinase family enzyme